MIQEAWRGLYRTESSRTLIEYKNLGFLIYTNVEKKLSTIVAKVRPAGQNYAHQAKLLAIMKLHFLTRVDLWVGIPVDWSTTAWPKYTAGWLNSWSISVSDFCRISDFTWRLCWDVSSLLQISGSAFLLFIWYRQFVNFRSFFF